MDDSGDDLDWQYLCDIVEANAEAAGITNFDYAYYQNQEGEQDNAK